VAAQLVGAGIATVLGSVLFSTGKTRSVEAIAPGE
jgi:hypothetical protein